MSTSIISPNSAGGLTSLSHAWSVKKAVSQLRQCPYHKWTPMGGPETWVRPAINAGDPSRKFPRFAIPAYVGPALEAYGFRPLHAAIRTGPWKQGDIVVLGKAWYIDSHNSGSGYQQGYVAMWDGTHWIGGYHFPANPDVYCISPKAYNALHTTWKVYRYGAAK